MIDCEELGEDHEWYQSGQMTYCYHCPAFSTPDPEDHD